MVVAKKERRRKLAISQQHTFAFSCLPRGFWAATMQLTCRNRFKRSFSGGYKVTNGSRVRKLEGDPDAMGVR